MTLLQSFCACSLTDGLTAALRHPVTGAVRETGKSNRMKHPTD